MHINNLRKYYFINKFETNNIDKLDNQSVVIYRNYNLKIPNIELVLKIKKYCKKKKIKFLLANNVRLAIKLNLDGAHIPSFNKSKSHLAFSLKTKFNIVGSAHNIKEIRTKEIQNVNKIFISSLFKKNKNYLGINKFKLISNYTKKKVVVLGGVSKKNLNKLKLLKTSEFAGTYFFE